MRVTDKHFQEWEKEAFGYGYGTGEAYILPLLHQFFATLPDGHAYTSERVVEYLDAAPAWLLINVLCRENILDYGTSPRNGWLTHAGELLREYVLSHSPEELYTIVAADMDPRELFCTRTFCTCPDGVDGQGCQNNPLWQPLLSVP